MIDTSTEVVERLAAQFHGETAAMIGALLAERNRMRKALETIRDMAVNGVSFNTIARAALGEDRT